MSRLLIDENPILLLPTLVKILGFEKATVLQQIYFMQNQPKSGKVLEDGRKWVWGTYEDWCRDYFIFWEARSLRRHITDLEKRGLVVSCKPKAKDWDQTKFYRVDAEAVDALLERVRDPESGTPSQKPAEDTAMRPAEDTSSVTAEDTSNKETETSTETSTEREAKPKKNELADVSEVPAASVTPLSLSQADDETSSEARAFAQMSGKRDPLLEKLEAERFFRRLLTQDVVTHPQVQPNLQSWFQFHGPEKLEAYKKAAFKQNERPPVFFFVDLCKGTRKLSTSLITSPFKTPPPRESLYKPGDMVLVGESELEIADVDPVGNWVMFREHGPVRPDMCCPL